MAHGKYACLNPARATNFDVDVLDVIAGRFRRDHQAARHFLARKPTGNKSEDVDLASGQASRSFASARDVMACNPQDRLDAVPVQPGRFHLSTQRGGSFFGGGRAGR